MAEMPSLEGAEKLLEFQLRRRSYLEYTMINAIQELGSKAATFRALSSELEKELGPSNLAEDNLEDEDPAEIWERWKLEVRQKPEADHSKRNISFCKFEAAISLYKTAELLQNYLGDRIKGLHRDLQKVVGRLELPEVEKGVNTTGMVLWAATRKLELIKFYGKSIKDVEGFQAETEVQRKLLTTMMDGFESCSKKWHTLFADPDDDKYCAESYIGELCLGEVWMKTPEYESGTDTIENEREVVAAVLNAPESDWEAKRMLMAAINATARRRIHTLIPVLHSLERIQFVRVGNSLSFEYH